MNLIFLRMEVNIKRFQNLLETSVDETERQMIQSLLPKKRPRPALQASEPDKK